MAKNKIKDPGAHHASSGALIRRFLPYLVKYKKTCSWTCSVPR